MTTTSTVAEPAEIALPARDPSVPGTKPRMLLVVNPRATTVSGRLKNLVAHALRSRYEVEAVETEGPNHATALAREAVAGGCEIVVAFGGDGTINETANGLAGSGVPLSILPGGCTNVVCRMLRIPTDIVDAAEHLLALADSARPRPIDLGVVNHRRFVSSAGVGLDGETTRWVDDHTRFKSRAGPLFFSYAGLVSFERYVRRPLNVIVEADGRRVEGVSAVIQNSDPYTFFKSRPVRVCEGTALDSGVLSMAALRAARQRDALSLGWRLLSQRPAARHHQIEDFGTVVEARVTGAPDREGRPQPFPIQVDGDYIGDFAEARLSIEPGALLVVA